MKHIYLVTLTNGKILRIFSSEEEMEEEARRYVETHNKYYQVNHKIKSIKNEEDMAGNKIRR
jgi:hypothetical protein